MGSESWRIQKLAQISFLLLFVTVTSTFMDPDHQNVYGPELEELQNCADVQMILMVQVLRQPAKTFFCYGLICISSLFRLLTLMNRLVPRSASEGKAVRSSLVSV